MNLCIREREIPALSRSDDVSFLNLFEARRQMACDILVPFLEAAVLADEVKVIAANHDAALHLGANNHALDHAATDGHVPRKRTFLVHVLCFLRQARSLEA